MIQVSYHEGGFIPTAPAQNRHEQWDSTSGQYTSWNNAGSQVESRALTVAEALMLAEMESSTLHLNNNETLRSRADTALASNSTFLAIGNPSAAQNAAQVKALTRQVNALIRLQLQDLSDVSDT